MAKSYKNLLRAGLVSVLLLAAVIPKTGYATSPGDFGLKEGDLIRAAEVNDLNIFIINEHGYKRLFLNPVIFGFYGHLGGFSAVKNVAVSTRDAFLLSSFYRNCENNDPRIYSLEITGDDTGILHWINIIADQALSQDSNFFKKVFCINNREFSWYPKGTNYSSLSQTEDYQFSNAAPESSPDLSVDLKINGTDNPGFVNWNEKITASWNSVGTSDCAGFEYMIPVDTSINTSNLPASGVVELYNRSALPITDKVTAHIICYDANKKTTEDFIEINITPSSKPSFSVISPTNENWKMGESKEIRWTSKNISSNVNIILTRKNPESIYKGDFWHIAKNIFNTGTYGWKVGEITMPVDKWGTTDYYIGPGSYAILLLNDEETIFAVSEEFFIK